MSDDKIEIYKIHVQAADKIDERRDITVIDEIGIADASSLPSARVTRSPYDRTLPSVVLALDKLSTDSEIDNWVQKHVR